MSTPGPGPVWLIRAFCGPFFGDADLYLTLRTLLSGSGWVYQHESCGASLDEAIEAARMTIEALSDRLEIHPSER